MSGFVVEEFTPMPRNTLRGFVTVRTPSGLVFHDVAIHHKNESFWASPAGKPMIGREGTQLKDANGKPRWTPVVSFATKEARDRFSTGVIDALRASHPDALA